MTAIDERDDWSSPIDEAALEQQARRQGIGLSLETLIADLNAQQEAERATWTCTCATCGARAKTTECATCLDARRERETELRAVVRPTRESIPAKFHWCSFDALELAQRVRYSAAIDRARSATKQNATSVVFIGPTGAGKTSLAVTFLLAKVESTRTAGLFMPARALAVARRNASLGHEADDVRAAMRAPLLLVDDLGIEPLIESSAVREVIAERYDSARLTIYTTGFDADGIAKRYDDAIARRVFEGATTISCAPPAKAGGR